MQTNILWAGKAYHSLENCLVETSGNGCTITSTIIGQFAEKIYRVEYHIQTNCDWETIFFEINCRHSNQTQLLRFEGNGKGGWINNGKRVEQFEGCIDIDIALTPFTNSLPINRLKLAPHQTQEIQVIYIDLLEQQIRPIRQGYTSISATTYHYENIPNDFEANIEVDDAGLVVDYPSLFVRTAAVNADYH